MRWKMLAAVLICAVAGAAWLTYRTLEGVQNAYAVWWVANMVIEHLKANDDQWPRNWEDLRDDYQTCVKRSGQPWTFDELRGRVTVDWGTDTEVLRKEAIGAQQPTFRVIWLTDGTDSHWECCEPNRLLYDYLRGTQQESGNARQVFDQEQMPQDPPLAHRIREHTATDGCCSAEGAVEVKWFGLEGPARSVAFPNSDRITLYKRGVMPGDSARIHEVEVAVLTKRTAIAGVMDFFAERQDQWRPLGHTLSADAPHRIHLAGSSPQRTTGTTIWIFRRRLVVQQDEIDLYRCMTESELEQLLGRFARRQR